MLVDAWPVTIGLLLPLQPAPRIRWPAHMTHVVVGSASIANSTEGRPKPRKGRAEADARLLAEIRARGKTFSVRGLAASMGKSGSAISHRIDRLQRAGALRRTVDGWQVVPA